MLKSFKVSLFGVLKANVTRTGMEVHDNRWLFDGR